MKRFFREMFSSVKRGFQEGAEGDEDKADWQISFDRLWQHLADTTFSDRDLVQEYFDFISRYPEKRVLENVRYFGTEMLRRRPGTGSIVQEYINKAKKID